MTNKAIYNLGSATVPLNGTEVIPLWNGSATAQVTVANLTAGRDITARSLALTTTASTNFFSAVRTGIAGIVAAADSGGPLLSPLIVDNIQIYNAAQSILRYEFNTATGDLKLNTGNLVQGTAAKGINFTANTPAAGMTSQLLNWYEEGTWTPVISGSGTAGTESGSKNATYTRIGNRVFARLSLSGFTLTGATGNINLTGLPFAAKWNGLVVYAEGFTPAFTAAIGSGGSVTLSTTGAATTTVEFRPSISASWDNYMTYSSTWTGGGGSTYMHIELWGNI